MQMALFKHGLGEHSSVPWLQSTPVHPSSQTHTKPGNRSCSSQWAYVLVSVGTNCNNIRLITLCYIHNQMSNAV